MASPIIEVLKEQIAETRGVLDSAVIFVESVPGLISAAIAQALANGASEEDLAPFVELEAALQQDTQELVDAIAANSGQA